MLYKFTYLLTVPVELRRTARWMAAVMLASNPDMGVMYLMEKGFMGQQTADVAKFLKSRRGLSRKAIGDFISHRSSFNAQVLK